ncbi:PfkB family carbohydrate kinase [Methylophaga sp.]|uniref:PfkB family carbohydrate kinase n=1 Tax=Methylophaga sp. TaxID=2024840 RepID=UPI003F6A4717
MATILAVGIATIDIINTVAAYPAEDDEIRALSQQQVRGGNATNTLTVLSQLGHRCYWTGVLIDEPDSDIVKQALHQSQIDFSLCQPVSEGKMPTSYITLSSTSGSRTIVHHRDCPELDFDHFQTLDLNQFDWVHFEGRNINELKKMLSWLKKNYPSLPCSLEVEKPRDCIESLFDIPDVLLFSRPYAEHCGYDNAESFLRSLALTATISCSWGGAGAWLKHQQEIFHSPAFSPEKIIDTLGAGDTFNAGLISALIKKQTPKQALTEACQLAGKKCGQMGYDNLLTAS